MEASAAGRDSTCVAALQRWTQTDMLAGHGWPPERYVCSSSRTHVDAQTAPLSNQSAAEWGARLRRALRGRGTLWFFGDSLTALHYWATMCKLDAEVDPLLAAPALARNASNIPPKRSASSTRPSLCLRMRMSSPLHNLSACFQPFKKTTSLQSTPAAMLRAFIPRLTSDDILVVNLGLHYGERGLALLQSETRALLHAHAVLPAAARPLLLWRETSPELFPTPTGRYPGQQRAPAWGRNVTCRNVTRQLDDGLYNRVTSPLVAAAGHRIVRVYDASRQRADDVRGWRVEPSTGDGAHTTSRATLDCVHFCLPSSTIAFWVDSLIAVVLDARAAAPPQLPSPPPLSLSRAPPPASPRASATDGTVDEKRAVDGGHYVPHDRTHLYTFSLLQQDRQTVEERRVLVRPRRSAAGSAPRRLPVPRPATLDATAAAPTTGNRSSSGRPRAPCACFSTCTRDKASAFVDEYLPISISSPQSLWYGYLTAVYTRPPPLPLATQELRFFYHNDASYWPPYVEWPMARCTMASDDARKGSAPSPACPASTCERWRQEAREEASAARAQAPAASAMTRRGGKVVRNVIVFGRRDGRSRGSLLVLSDHLHRHDHATELCDQPGEPGHARRKPSSCERVKGGAGVYMTLGATPMQARPVRFWPTDSHAEVMRVDYDDDRFASRGRAMYGEGMNGYGIWFYAAPGSGMWLPLGRTLVAPHFLSGDSLNRTWAANASVDRTAVDRYRARTKGRTKGVERWPMYANGLGYDTVQKMGGTLPLEATEIVCVRPECVDARAAVHACPPSQLTLRVGVPPFAVVPPSPQTESSPEPRNSSACVCDESEPMLNCRGVAEAEGAARKATAAAWPYWLHHGMMDRREHAFYLRLAK